MLVLSRLGIILATLSFSKLLLPIIAKNEKVPTVEPNYVVTIRTLNVTYADQSVINGKSWIQDNKIYINNTVSRDILALLEILALAKFQKTRRVLFNKTLDICHTAEMKKAKDLVLRMIVMPILQQAKLPNYCPLKKVVLLGLKYLLKLNIYSICSVTQGVFILPGYGVDENLFPPVMPEFKWDLRINLSTMTNNSIHRLYLLHTTGDVAKRIKSVSHSVRF